MTALFEGGNSRLHFGWWDGATVSGVVHGSYPAVADAWTVRIRELLGNDAPELIMACSVSPHHAGALFAALEAEAPGRVRIVGVAADLGVRVRYERPERYGIDRALAALAAHRRFRDSCVVIDAGTAVTVDAVAADGTVVGGYIIPGAETMAHALAAKTGLPPVRPGDPDGLLGTSTETCIGRGISEALAGAVRRLFDRAAESVAAGTRVLVTGGGGRSLIAALPVGAEYRPDLVLEGLGLASGR